MTNFPFSRPRNDRMFYKYLSLRLFKLVSHLTVRIGSAILAFGLVYLAAKWLMPKDMVWHVKNSSVVQLAVLSLVIPWLAKFDKNNKDQISPPEEMSQAVRVITQIRWEMLPALILAGNLALVGLNYTIANTLAPDSPWQKSLSLVYKSDIKPGDCE